MEDPSTTLLDRSLSKKDHHIPMRERERERATCDSIARGKRFGMSHDAVVKIMLAAIPMVGGWQMLADVGAVLLGVNQQQAKRLRDCHVKD